MEKLNKRKIELILKVVVTIVFAILLIFLARFHEPWSDEAQSFLLARDNNISELFYYMKYEGTPPLWVIIIKIFILLGGTYSNFYLLPILFSVLGLAIFELKVKAPLYIKLLFPFTYFIFYQYSIVARSYCLVFPVLMLLALVYEKRFEKPFLFSFILFLLMNISLHTLVISGSLYLLFLIDIFKNKLNKNQKIRVAIILIFLELLFTALIAMPNSDCAFVQNHTKNTWHVISESTVGSELNTIFEVIISIVILITIFLGSKNIFKEVIRFLIVFLPVSLIYNFVAYQGWHIGIITLLLFTYFIVSNKINEDRYIKIFLVVLCLVQISWSITSFYYDINNEYCSALEVSKFLKENKYENKVIYGLGYGVTAIQPYFEKNIFLNENSDKSFYFWKYGNGYLSLEQLASSKADIYVVAKFYEKSYKSVTQQIEKDNYKKYEFESASYIKNHIYENLGYTLYIKEENK